MAAAAALKAAYDVVIVGGGHNGLVSAGYLARAGFSVCVLERRHVLGGAAVTEEIVPGFQFSRASYLLSLLRPHIYTELQLKEHGLKLLTRDPSSYTPLSPDRWSPRGAKSLTLGADPEKNFAEIAKFSVKDAENFPKYEKHIEAITEILDPLFDVAPHDLGNLLSKRVGLLDKLGLLYNNKHIREYVYNVLTRRAELRDIYSLLTCSAHTMLTQWFESEPLRATLLTDGLIGALVSPHSPSTSYVLLHHVMGGVDGEKGVWAYPEGGMGAVSRALASSARSHGAQLFTDQPVSEVTLDSDHRATGVVTHGKEVRARYVLSNATLKCTLMDLIPEGTLDEKVIQAVHSVDYASPVTKINVALKSIPNFLSNPNPSPNSVQPHHQASIHINCEDMQQVVQAYEDAALGVPSRRPMIEMVLPSSLDTTLSPPGHHVCLLFTQFTPYTLADGAQWTEEVKTAYARTVFACVEQYCPGFEADIVGYEVLSPPDLEREFGLTGGNIFHGALSLNQLLFNRPLPSPDLSSPFTPIPHLLLCGSGAHPGGGVCGAPGYIAAHMVTRLMRK